MQGLPEAVITNADSRSPLPTEMEGQSNPNTISFGEEPNVGATIANFKLGIVTTPSLIDDFKEKLSQFATTAKLEFEKGQTMRQFQHPSRRCFTHCLEVGLPSFPTSSNQSTGSTDSKFEGSSGVEFNAKNGFAANWKKPGQNWGQQQQIRPNFAGFVNFEKSKLKLPNFTRHLAWARINY